MLVVRVAFRALWTAMTVAALSCMASGSHVTTPGGGGTAATTSGGAPSSGGALGGGGEATGGGLLFDAGPGGDAGDPDAPCGLITKQAKSTPVDLYIMLDQSQSMAGSTWSDVKAALALFVNDPVSSGLVVALNFFPVPGTTPICAEWQYESPAVPFGVLPQNAAVIVAEMDAITPSGFSTPIFPALQGAITAAHNQADQYPGDAAAVLLVTDGSPQGPPDTCAGVSTTDPAAIAGIAANGLSIWGVRTFVVGLTNNVNHLVANQVAAAGGTGTAIFVASGDVQAQFAAALAQVRGEALPCTYQIPTEVSGGQVDTDHVNVVITPGGGTPAVLPQNPTCNGPGWKYDDPNNPTEIILCAQSCGALKTDMNALAEIMLGCKTQVVK